MATPTGLTQKYPRHKMPQSKGNTGTATNRPCFLMKRNGAGYEWIASANPQTPWQPAGSHTAFKTHRHNKGTLLCKVFLIHQLIQTPH